MAGLFKFDLKAPLLTGTLSKQGNLMKTFKKRFFVLYPDFLVYYHDTRTWNGDVWRQSLAVSYRIICGLLETFRMCMNIHVSMQCRSGAVYLKSATCTAADNECQFGILVTVPDQRNKRR